MAKRIPNDPIAAYRRKSTSKRRVGENAKCSRCGESRPEALNSKQRPLLCEECRRKAKGTNTLDQHHPLGRANSPFTIPIPANDHRANLSTAQGDWPKATLENRDGCPFLRDAAAVRGFLDADDYFKRSRLPDVAENLERVSAFMVQKFGAEWWADAELRELGPKGKSHEE